MRQNTVKALLREGRPAVGAWLSLGSTQVAHFMGRLGFDWLTIDLEHNPITLDTAAEMVLAIAAGGTPPFVRVPWNTGENLKRVLDSGAWGVVVPMVNSREEAEAAVAHAKHPPVGRRSIGGSYHALSFGADPGAYYARANDEIAVVVQCEHIRAVEAAEEILGVPGIDACFIGPNDLAASMGVEPSLEPRHPEVIRAVERVLTAARRCGVAPGIHVPDAEAANRRIREGFQLIAVASDLAFLLGRARQQLEALERPQTPGPEQARY